MGNVLIIVALPKVSTIHGPSKLLFRCLASTDLGVGLILQPVYIAYLMSSEYSISCYYLDTISKVIAVIFCGVSLLTLTAISVGRLLALLLGLRYKHVVTLRRVWVFVILFWVFSSASAMTYVGDDDLVTINIISTVMLMCMLTSTFCYTKIFLTLRHHKFQVQDQVSQKPRNEERTPLNIARFKRTVSSALWVQMTLLACYLPFGVATAVAGVSETYPPTLALVWELTVSLLTFNSSLNPLLYCWKIRGIRKAVKETVKKGFCLAR